MTFLQYGKNIQESRFFAFMKRKTQLNIVFTASEKMVIPNDRITIFFNDDGDDHVMVHFLPDKELRYHACASLFLIELSHV